jgi:hypothetical protein
MQELKMMFFAILLAHFLGDFVFQTNRIVAAKDRFRGYVEHGLIHFGLLIACLSFTGIHIFSWHVQLLLLAYIVIHLLLDFLKHVFTKGEGHSNSALVFIADQILHVTGVSLLAFLMGSLKWNELLSHVNWPIENRERVLIVAVVYTSTVFAGGYLIRYLIQSLEVRPQQGSGETEQELRNAGMYIGWLERFLVISAVIMQSPAMIGLILTGKSIARFPELKEARFSEYFLIGTSLSVSLALLAGLILVRIFYGTISLK